MSAVYGISKIYLNQIKSKLQIVTYSLHHGGLGVCGKLLWGGARARLLGGVTENFQDHLQF